MIQIMVVSLMRPVAVCEWPRLTAKDITHPDMVSGGQQKYQF